jgi:hypothetical protein
MGLIASEYLMRESNTPKFFNGIEEKNQFMLATFSFSSSQKISNREIAEYSGPFLPMSPGVRSTPSG